MRLARLLLASLFLVPMLLAGEILKLKGDPIKGEIVSVSETEVVYKQGDKQIKLPIADVLKIDFGTEKVSERPEKYSRVELTDGTIVLVSKWGIVKRELTMTLLSGPTVTVPLETVANVLNRAEDAKHTSDWRSRTFNTRGREALVRKRDGVISNIEVTFGNGDAKGEKIKGAVNLGGVVETNEFSLAAAHGLIFRNVLGPKAPAIRCKLLDKHDNLVIVSGLTATTEGLSVITPSGAKFQFKKDQLRELDYSKGKLEYLSALDPVKVEAKSNLDEGPTDQWHVYKDTNLNKGPLTLGGVVYSRGLAIKPHAEITWDLKGEYRELSFLVGIDDNVSADGKTILIVECDGKEREPIEISSTDKKRFKPVTMNIKDVQKLKIIVKSDGEFDVARHLDLADAKVSK